MTYTKQGEKMREAAQAHSDLNMFHAVIALMEHSLFHSGDAAQQRIIKICQIEAQKCLAQYDRAIEAAGGGTYGREPKP